MFSTKIRTLVRQQWAGLIALFFVLGGGVASATHPGGANTISSGDIINNNVRFEDLAADSVGTAKIIDGGVRSPDVLDGNLTGVDVADNSLKGADIDESTLDATGPRAYGRVSGDGLLTRSKNVTLVGHPDAGTYCIRLAAGIDPNSAVLVVGPDFRDNDTDPGGADVSVVEWRSSGADCPAGSLQVDTFVYDGDITDDNDGSGDDEGDFLVVEDEPFAFVVP